MVELVLITLNKQLDLNTPCRAFCYRNHNFILMKTLLHLKNRGELQKDTDTTRSEYKLLEVEANQTQILGATHVPGPIFSLIGST